MQYLFDNKSTVVFSPYLGDCHKSSVLYRQPSAFIYETRDFSCLRKRFPEHRAFGPKIRIVLGQQIGLSPFNCFNQNIFKIFSHKMWNLESVPSEITYQTLLSLLERMELMGKYSDEHVLDLTRCYQCNDREWV